MQIIDVKRVTQGSKHHAFTDLCDFNGILYCSFRVADNHVSDDGQINVVTLSESAEVLYTQRIIMPDTDLRDPKLSVTPTGELLLLAYARRTSKTKLHGELGNQYPVIWLSQDGLSWSSPKNIGEKHWWLWRLRWHDGKAYGIAYNRSKNAVHLYSGDPKRSFHRHRSQIFSLQKHNKGYPNESDMCFAENGTAHVILRRDSDTYSAQLGSSKPPYSNWQWRDLGFYLGGPNMLRLNNDSALLAGRVIYKTKLVTAILNIDLKSAKVSLLTILPSAGDNSYPAMVKRGNRLFISYYSSHQDQQAHIYLAELTLP
ncbi:hypothetical protein [Paraglaciecola sp. 20A4]|uniref:hypothetical protein n=1 Tax=Paraglaciecola sp. 20A4 TaxID=2687288 RepID=UPI00140C85A2|nr:hypothetical protein [Paraglaciecola sp. 20A4]